MQESRMKPIFALALAALVSTAAVAQPAMSEGQVLKVDKPGLRITLKHDGVKHLDMPAMTMAFRVGNPKLLDEVAVGDKVRFAADKVGGSYMLVTLSKAR
jgi:Cu(I)/Ag(I) efflux system periplasmic protein CusF